LCRKCRKLYPSLAAGNAARRREENRGKTAYGRGSTSGAYGRSSYSMKSGTFDGLPSLSRRRGDGATEIFYQAGSVDMDDVNHGHAVIKNGKLVYKRRPGESTPVIDEE
jgi:hypothetical protein